MMNGPINGWQLLCVVIILVTAATAIGASQSTETTVNATEPPNTTSTTIVATTATGTGSPVATETPVTSITTDRTGTTPSQSPTQTLRSDQAADDAPENATPIEVGETVTGRLPVGDQDWSTFTVEPPARITVSITARNQTDMSAFLYGSEDLLDSSFVSPGEQFSLAATVESGGQYYVFVRNEANDTKGTYAFEVSASEPATDQPVEEPTGDTDSSGNGLGFWTVALLGAVVLFGFLAFRRGGDGAGEDSSDGPENEADGDDKREEEKQEG